MIEIEAAEETQVLDDFKDDKFYYLKKKEKTITEIL